MVEKPLRQWRLTRGEPFGSHVWFDPNTEFVRLYSRIPSADGEEVAVVHRVAVEGSGSYLDKVGSVSEPEDEDEPSVQELAEQVNFLEEEDDLPF